MAVVHFSNGRTSERDRSPMREWGEPESAALGMAVKVGTVGADAVAISLAFVVSAIVNAGRRGEDTADYTATLLVGLAAVPVWLAIFTQYGLYAARRLARRGEELRRALHAVAAATAATALLIVTIGVTVVRGWLLGAALLAAVLVVAERQVIRLLMARLRRHGRLLRPAVVVGANAEARALVAMLDADPRYGYEVRAVVADDPSTPDVAGHVIAGNVRELLDVIGHSRASCCLVATTAVDDATANRIARDLSEAGVHVQLSAGLRDVAVERLSVQALGRVPTLSVEPVRRSGWRAMAKRAFDVVMSVVGLAMSMPIVALAAVAIVIESGRPVFFRQTRIGVRGHPFQVVKLRTMHQDAEERRAELLDLNEADGPLFKILDDPRVTAVGGLLRKASVDELPQLWNVLRGEMSLVGPRPALPEEVLRWDDGVLPRLRVKPGMTGMWQVNGRSTASFDDYVRLDLYYVENWSLVTDLTVLAKTVPAVLSRKGAH